MTDNDAPTDEDLMGLILKWSADYWDSGKIGLLSAPGAAEVFGVDASTARRIMANLGARGYVEYYNSNDINTCSISSVTPLGHQVLKAG